MFTRAMLAVTYCLRKGERAVEPGLKLRQAYGSPEVTPVALIGDAQSGRLAELAGFPAAVLASAPVANGLLGMPDAGLLTLTEMEFVTARTAAACDIPIVVDAETGYGDAINMMRTVRTLEQAGAAGIHIEDQQNPPQVIGGPVISTAEMVGKIKAALDARKNDSFLVRARTDSWYTEGLDAAIERGQHYVEAGVDAFYLPGRLTIEERRRVVQEVPAPFHLTVLGDQTTIAELAALGFCAVSTNHAPMHEGALVTFRRYGDVLRTGTSGGNDFRRDAAGTPLEGWELGDHGTIARFDVAELAQRYGAPKRMK